MSLFNTKRSSAITSNHTPGNSNEYFFLLFPNFCFLTLNISLSLRKSETLTKCYFLVFFSIDMNPYCACFVKHAAYFIIQFLHIENATLFTTNKSFLYRFQNTKSLKTHIKGLYDRFYYKLLFLHFPTKNDRGKSVDFYTLVV